jgi:hypothetical protein
MTYYTRRPIAEFVAWGGVILLMCVSVLTGPDVDPLTGRAYSVATSVVVFVASAGATTLAFACVVAITKPWSADVRWWRPALGAIALVPWALFCVTRIQHAQAPILLNALAALGLILWLARESVIRIGRGREPRKP